MSRRCENCVHWSSTDKVWGSCSYASTRDDGAKIAHATYVRLGREEQAELETKYSFGCVIWKSLRAALATTDDPTPPPQTRASVPAALKGDEQ